jgi:hypothetical protein
LFGLNQIVHKIEKILSEFCRLNKIPVARKKLSDDDMIVEFPQIKSEFLFTSKNQSVHENQFLFNYKHFEKQQNIILNKVLVLHQKAGKIYARNTVVKRIDKKTAETFFNTYHLLGYCNAYYKFGLMNNSLSWLEYAAPMA